MSPANTKNDVNFPHIFPAFKKLEIKKGTILLHQGEISKYIYQVTKGCLRSYVTDSAGKEYILQFAPEGWIISDMNSVVNEVPAAISIEAIEDSEAFVYDKKEIPSFEKLPKEVLTAMLKSMQNNIIAINKRMIHLLSSTGEERYLDFIKTYPSLIQRLSLKLIAAYLGITPEFLSRIRKNLPNR